MGIEDGPDVRAEGEVSEIEDKIKFASMRPQPGTQTGEAWALGARQGWQWAADEIERLRDLADKYKWQVRDTCTRAENAEAEIERLRGDIRSWEMAAGRRPVDGVIAEAAARSMRERAGTRADKELQAMGIGTAWERKQVVEGIDALPLIEDKP